ncbi:hypothetical protein CHS0354_020014 [Potamilus streckersoni]|uniref:Uncharacterized protein n=1 Tax=Potamilus streckersoni TaxID=2493646 RepID=A0AAE0S7I8_9BIVA|nr:hypothetical protein CHS0354_020014 [Potamilus streckersoni]
MINKKFKKGHICKGCYNCEVRSSWISFIMFFLPTIASILVGIFVTSSGPIAGILMPLSFLLLIIVWGSKKVYKAAKSPFSGDKKRVEDMQDMHEGDVIQYRYPIMLHEAIVSSVDFGNCSRIGKVHVVHYGKKTLFSKREIIEEALDIDLDKMEIYNLDYSCYNVHKRDEVVNRARQRVGEKKFGFFNNRSCHFCHWAKVNEGFDAISTSDIVNDSAFDLSHFPYQIFKDQSLNHPPSTSLIEQSWVKIKSEVSGGDPIEFSYRGHWHKGICTHISSTKTARDLQINVVHYSYHGPFDVPEVREEDFHFDLSVENVYVYNYHPAHRYSRAEIIDRARSKIGEKKYNMLFRNSGHLVEEITLKEREEVINSPHELCEGDIISFCYYGRRQTAVLVSIIRDKNDTKCDMNVIHYGKSGLLATRTVLEEKISIDLAKNNLRKVNFLEYFTYPGYVVVERAKRILGEQRFNRIYNNSYHLVHWAKVDNRKKAINFVRMGIDLSLQLNIMDENQNKTLNQDVHIVPFNIISGKEKRHHYMELVRSWEELIKGHIVEFKYYCIWHQGILTEVNIGQEIIKVIHYGAKHLFATRTILEEERKVNLKKENLYIYHPDPEYASSSDEVIRYARSKLREQKWGSGNRSSDFCRECVLRKKQAIEDTVQVE